MAGKEENRIFVGGLSWETTDRQLEDAFSRYGKILEAQVLLLPLCYVSQKIMIKCQLLSFC